MGLLRQQRNEAQAGGTRSWDGPATERPLPGVPLVGGLELGGQIGGNAAPLVHLQAHARAPTLGSQHSCLPAPRRPDVRCARRRPYARVPRTRDSALRSRAALDAERSIS